MATKNLIRLASALIEDEALRQKFNQTPGKVMKDFDLDAADKKALYAMTPEKIGNEIKAALMSYPFPEEEFPACSEDYTPEPGSTETEYPDPVPGIYRVRPKKIKKSEISGEKFEVIVTGKSFPRGPKAVVKVRQLSNGNTWKLSGEPYGTFRCSRLIAMMVPESPNGTIATGNYQIFLEMPDGTVLERDRPNPQTDPDFVVEA